MMNEMSDKHDMDDEMQGLVRGNGVTCARALAYARQNNISAAEVGARLTALEIKILDCQLGCFGQHREDRLRK